MTTALVFTTILLAITVILAIFSFFREEDGASVRPESSFKRSMHDRAQTWLLRAGYIDAEPSFFYTLLGMMFAAVAILIFFLSGNPYLMIFALPTVSAGVYLFLVSKERSYMRRASEEMVPFLNRVLAAVGSGTSAQNAFISSLEGTHLIKHALSEELQDLYLSRPLNEVLRSSIEKFPLRSWEQFARHLTMQIERGGDLESVLESSVEQINNLIQLQAELRADFSRAQNEQVFIIFICFGSLIFINIFMGGLFLGMFSSIIGWLGFILGLSMMLGGIVFGQKNVRDIEKKLDF